MGSREPIDWAGFTLSGKYPNEERLDFTLNPIFVFNRNDFECTVTRVEVCNTVGGAEALRVEAERIYSRLMDGAAK